MSSRGLGDVYKRQIHGVVLAGSEGPFGAAVAFTVDNVFAVGVLPGTGQSGVALQRGGGQLTGFAIVRDSNNPAFVAMTPPITVTMRSNTARIVSKILLVFDIVDGDSKGTG